MASTSSVGYRKPPGRSVRALYNSKFRDLYSTTPLTPAGPSSYPPFPTAPPLPAVTTDFFPRGYNFPSTFPTRPTDANVRSLNTQYTASHGQTLPTPYSLPQESPNPYQPRSTGRHFPSQSMDPFARYDTSPSSGSIAQFSADPFEFGDETFQLKTSQTLGVGFTRGLPQGDFASLGDFDLPFDGGLTRDEQRKINFSSPDVGSTSSSNAPSPAFACGVAFGSLPDLIPSMTQLAQHHSLAIYHQSWPIQQSDGIELGIPRGFSNYKHQADGNEYVTEACDSRVDDLDDPLVFMGMGPHSRRNSRDSQRSWRALSDNSFGLEEENSGRLLDVGRSPSSRHCPINQTHFNTSRRSAFCVGREEQTLFPSLMMLRSDSHASDVSSSSGSPLPMEGVNPNDVNPRSQPVTPAERTTALGNPFDQGWWKDPASRIVDALTDELNMSMVLGALAGPATAVEEDDCESTLRAKERTRGGLAGVFTVPPCGDLMAPSTSTNVQGGFSDSFNIDLGLLSSFSTSSTISQARGCHARGVDRSSPGPAARSRARRSHRGLLGITDYSDLPTKRSRGRRPASSKDVGLASPDGTLARGLQAVSGGAAFDPSLHPMAAAVEYCETTKTGKPKKMFVCEVIACGKVFKRSEHLKRHVRSIHTHDKPFACPWMTCTKMFNRHDNLNQHLRVHRMAEDRGHVLEGLAIGSDGVLRREEDGECVDPIPLGLKKVELEFVEDDDFDAT